MHETWAWRREVPDAELGLVTQIVFEHDGQLLGFEGYADGEMSKIVRLDSAKDRPADFEAVSIKPTNYIADRLQSQAVATA